MTDALTKLIADNKERPIAELEGCIGHEPVLVMDKDNGGCPFIAFQMPARTEWRYYFEGVEFEIADCTHFRPLPDDRLARVTEVLLKALDDIEEYTHEVVTRFTCSQIRKQITAIAEGKDNA